MNVIKRDGSLEAFDKKKIRVAVSKAMTAEGRRDLAEAGRIADEIEKRANNHDISVASIEWLVFQLLCERNLERVARAYEGYRAVRAYQREHPSRIEEQIQELVAGNSDYWNNENSNKNAKLVTTQRDYMAGIVSTEITRKYLLPPDIVQAHDKGILHFHDADYMGQNALTNCCLINLDDMLQYGTVINGVKINKPHRLLTATTIASQIITAVSSSQYGGCTITLSHLAPFVRDSYNWYLNKYKRWGINDEDAKRAATVDLYKEIKDAVQTFNYQVNSMSTTNGQAPFITVFMYIDENPEYKDETALLIDEFLYQRIEGMPDRTGHMVTPAFPKLIYALNEDNINPDSEYYWVTKRAAKSTAKRMNPDYVSVKVMKDYKGEAFPSIN